METLLDRFNIALDGRSKASVARHVKVEPQVLSNWVSRNSLPNDYVFQMADFLGVSPEWLSTGIGDISHEYLKEQERRYNEDLDNSINVKIPIYDIEASGGTGSLNQLEGIDSFFIAEKSYLGDIGVPLDHLKIITIRGDSMQPDLNSGDMVLVHHVSIPADKMHDGMFVIMIDELLYIKRLQRLPKKKIKIISSNKEAYEPFTVDADDLQVIGQVVFAWCGKKF